jgi:nucleotide-binding universal stress UspA family protein
MYLARNSKASSLTVVFRDPDSIRDETVAEGIRQLVERAEDLADAVELRFRSVRGRPSRALASLPEEESIGAIVTGLPEGGTGIRAIRAAALVRQTGRPILLSRGSQPYRRILVPARHTPSGRAAVRAAIDLARFSKGELHCAAILDPVFISGPHPPTDARSAMAWIEEEAAVHGVDVSGTICRGNPVRKLLDLASSSDLVVLGVDVTHGWMAPRMGVGRMVAQRAPRSVLLVPADESA